MGKRRGSKQSENMSLQGGYEDRNEASNQEETINRALRNAGLLEPGMDMKEKQEVYNAVQQSSRDAKAQLDHSKTSDSPNRDDEDVFDNGDGHKSSGKGGSDQADTPNTLITDDESSLESSPSPSDVQRRLPACTVSIVKCDAPQSVAGATTTNTQGRGRGRGRGRFSLSTAHGSGIRKPSNLSNFQSPQLQSAPSCLSLKSSSSGKHNENPHNFESVNRVQQKASPQSCYDDDAIERQIENETDLIPLADKDEDISEDELVTNEATSTDPIMERVLSPLLFEESPLASMQSKCTETSCPDYLVQIKNVTRARWLEEARKVALHLRSSRWDRIRNENSEWDTITDFSKQTPSYSSLLGGSGSLRSQTLMRQAKQASPNYKCDDEDSDSDIFDPKFSRTKSVMKQQEDIGKVPQQSSAWNQQSKNKTQEEPPTGSRLGFSPNDKSSTVEVHPKSDSKSSHIMESESDSAGSPEADPAADPYEFIDKNWKTAPNPRGKKRGGKQTRKSSEDGDWQSTTKPNMKGKGRKNRDNRVATGAIARPQKDQQSRMEPLNSANSEANNHNENLNQNHKNSETRPTKSNWTDAVTKQTVHLEIKPHKFFNKPNQSLFKQIHSKGTAGTSNSSASPDHDDDKPEVVFESPTKNVVKLPCPICTELFLADDIETHASSCEAFPDAGQGDTEEGAEEGMGEEELEEANEPKHCAKVEQPCHVCEKMVSLDEMDRHICTDRVTSPTIGHKRSSGDEGGPVKKCTRRLGLRGK